MNYECQLCQRVIRTKSGMETHFREKHNVRYQRDMKYIETTKTPDKTAFRMMTKENPQQLEITILCDYPLKIRTLVTKENV